MKAMKFIKQNWWKILLAFWCLYVIFSLVTQAVVVNELILVLGILTAYYAGYSYAIDVANETAVDESHTDPLNLESKDWSADHLKSELSEANRNIYELNKRVRYTEELELEIEDLNLEIEERDRKITWLKKVIMDHGIK
jgi:peptidoglycan hydrolase CwlO-like protein